MRRAAITTLAAGITATGFGTAWAQVPPSPAGLRIADTRQGDCWSLRPVDRVRLFPAPGLASALEGGKIEGSNESPTNGFVELATVGSGVPGQWLEIASANATAYRFVKYYGPSGSYGALAELEMYAGDERLTGEGFGTFGSRNGSDRTFDKALDGDTGSYFEGPIANDQYVGLDLAAGHVASSPTFEPQAGRYDVPQTVSLSSETPGAVILYTTDGNDPLLTGSPYTTPISIAEGLTTIKAVATHQCSFASPTTQASYTIGDGPLAYTSIHIGNSLTDTIEGYLDAVAASDGVTLDLHKYTIPGAGTWAIWENPTGGIGEANIQQSLQTIPFDHLSTQPYPNMPCYPIGPGSDSDYTNRFYDLAKIGNPDVQLWIYQQWPKPMDWADCLAAGASWAEIPWMPPSQPTNWEEAVANQLWYQEQVRQGVMDLNPGGRDVYVVPGGTALANLKQAVEAGQVPGIAPTDFLLTFFNQAGQDDHLLPPGRWFISLVFYAAMFQANPANVSHEGSGLTAEQAAVLEQIAWDTVVNYPYSGINR